MPAKNRHLISYGLFALVFVALFSCSPSPTSVADNNTGAGWAYPMKVGNRWTYTRTLTYTDSSGTIVAADTQRVASTIPRTDMLNNAQVYVLRDSADTSTESYVELRTDGLYMRGMVPGAVISLEKSAARRAIDPYAHIYTHPRLLFPVQVATLMLWTLDTIIEVYGGTVPNDTSLIVREYLGIDTVTTPMGKLACRKFSTWYPAGEVVDYVSSMGLTKRTMEQDSVPFATITPQSYPGITLIFTTYREELVLTSAQLK